MTSSALPLPMPFPGRFPIPWDKDVPVPSRLPSLIEQSLRRHRTQAAGSSVDQPECVTEEELRSWIASSSLDWAMRNHLVDHLQKTLPLASSPEQKAVLEQLAKNCKGWNEAELRKTKVSLKPLTPQDLWSLKVRELKVLARELYFRGIKDPAEPYLMRKLAIYTGSGVHKEQAIQGIWNALNNGSSSVDSES